jgi:hypothetical protein
MQVKRIFNMTAQPRNLWIPLLIAFVIGSGLLASMFFPPFMAWGAITVIMLGAILIGHPRHILFLFWVWASFRPLILQMADHSVVRGSNGFFYAAIIGICFAGYVWRRTDTGRISVVFKMVTALLGVTLASFLVNRSPIFNITWFFMNYLAFPFVFYVAYTTLDRRHWRWLVGGVIGLMLIQFALNIGWRFGANPLPNIWTGTGNTYDLAQGTFGTCAQVAYFMVAVIFLLFSALRLRTKYKPWIILLLGVAVIQLYMAYTNHSYIMFMVLLPIYLVLSKQSVRVRMACVVMVILGALAFSFFAAWDTSSGSVEASVDSMLTAENLELRWDRFSHGPKIELINRIAVQNVSRDPMLWLFGNGPGNGLSAVGMKHNNAFAWEYLGEFVANTDNFTAKDMSSISGSFYSGILSIWSELGVGGYLLYLGIYVYVIGRVTRRLIKNQYRDVFQRVLAEGFVMAMLMFLFVSLLQDVFWVPYFTVGLWIWAAMVWDPVAPEDGEQTSDVGGQTSAVSGQLPARRGLQPGGRSEALNQKNSKTAPVANGWQRAPLRK